MYMSVYACIDIYNYMYMYRNIYISILTRIHAQTHSVCKHRGEQRKTPWLFELFRGLLCPAIWGFYGILISDYKGPYQSTSRMKYHIFFPPLLKDAFMKCLPFDECFLNDGTLHLVEYE